MKIFILSFFLLASFNVFSQSLNMGKVTYTTNTKNGDLSFCKSNGVICSLHGKVYSVGTPCMCSNTDEDHYVDEEYFEDSLKPLGKCEVVTESYTICNGIKYDRSVSINNNLEKSIERIVNSNSLNYPTSRAQ